MKKFLTNINNSFVYWYNPKLVIVGSLFLGYNSIGVDDNYYYENYYEKTILIVKRFPCIEQLKNGFVGFSKLFMDSH